MKNDVLAQLQKAQSTITSAMELCLKTKKVKEINTALSSAKEQTTEAMSSVLSHPNRRSLSKTKKSLQVLDNLVSGLMNGLAQKELGVKDFRAVCSTVQTKFIPQFSESLSNEAENFSQAATEPELSDTQKQIRDAVMAATENTVAEPEEGETEREERIARERRDRQQSIANDKNSSVIEQRFARYREERSRLPMALKTPYSVVRMSIHPRFENGSPTNPILLEKLGIPYSEIPLGSVPRSHGINTTQKVERYIILEQQMVLLVSKSHLSGILDRKKEDLQDENKEEFKSFRVRRKKLAAELLTATENIEKARRAVADMESQAAEIKRLSEKIATFNSRIQGKLKSSYTEEDQQKIDARKAKLSEIDSLSEQHYALYQKRKTNFGDKLAQEHEEVKSKLDSARLELNDLNKEVEEINRKYQTKYPEITKDMEQLAICERKLTNAQKIETQRQRMVADAETTAQRIKDAQERNEEALKEARRGAKVEKKHLDDRSATNEDYARSIISVINERTGSKYDLVTPKPIANPRNSKDILCFWIMPAGKLSAMVRGSGGKATVQYWDFLVDRNQKDDVVAEASNLEDRQKKHVDPREVPGTQEFYELSKNKHLRPKGWKSKYGKPVKRLI